MNSSVRLPPISESSFNYRALRGALERSKGRHVRKLAKRYQKLTREWSDELNTEWILRHYLAAKLILTAELFLRAYRHSRKMNVRLAEPYFGYYSALCCARAVCLTVPEQSWNKGQLFTLSHGKSIEVAAGAFDGLDSDLGVWVKTSLYDLKRLREIFSYRFPLEGFGGEYGRDLQKASESLGALARALSEVAHLNSECMQAVVDKEVPSGVGVSIAMMEELWLYGVMNNEVLGEDDAARLLYLERKVRRPIKLSLMVTEGMVDDLMMGLEPMEGCAEGAFDPWEFCDEFDLGMIR